MKVFLFGTLLTAPDKLGVGDGTEP